MVGGGNGLSSSFHQGTGDSYPKTLTFHNGGPLSKQRCDVRVARHRFGEEGRCPGRSLPVKLLYIPSVTIHCGHECG